MELSDAELNLLLKGSAAIIDVDSSDVKNFQDAIPDSSIITKTVAADLLSLSLLPAFSGLLSSLTSDTADWIRFLDDPQPERYRPKLYVYTIPQYTRLQHTIHTMHTLPPLPPYTTLSPLYHPIERCP